LEINQGNIASVSGVSIA